MDKNHQAAQYLEQHYLDVVDFYKQSHTEGDYIPLCVIENSEHELEPLLFEVNKKDQTKDIELVLDEFQQKIQKLHKKKLIHSAVIIYHIDKSNSNLKPARSIEDANAFMIILYLDLTYYFLLPYLDKGEEILYEDIRQQEENDQ